ncbi:uncharacterized protein LOC117342856 [Pecten maximus]|uniref:uncharacterized protein LOC117342856 n=1 Tax=Pecten maximus TaxID=6579 RepID=UPI001457E7C2|nr:uncharacterized protein LOC117342856 [Pecten maximus]
MGAVMKKTETSGKEAGVPTESETSEMESLSLSTRPSRRELLEAMAVTQASRHSGAEYTFLSLWDMGGHMSFQASHNIFISSHGVYLLIFRLTDFLKDKLETDRLKKWIRLIGTFLTGELSSPNVSTQKIQAPPLIFVGTFLDELKKTSKDYNKQIMEIRESITKFPELAPFHFVRFCTVDNSLGNDDRDLEILRGFITEAAEHQDQWERELPTTWLKFELDLFQAREKGTRILPLSEVIEMNKRSLAPLMDEDEIKLVLEFLHCTRSVIYFREYDYVIIDPQWLADFFSILITDDEFLPKDDLRLNRDLELYKTKGELNQNLIECLLSMKKNEDFAPFRSVLLALMEKFGLIVKVLLSKTAAKVVYLSETYTVPSKLLELQNIDGLTDKVNLLICRNLAVSKTLCLVFEDVFVPYELFQRILARVLNTYKTSPLSGRSFEKDSKSATDCLYMGFGCFEVDDLSKMILSMHAERSTIAVTVFSPIESQLPADSGKCVKLTIERILEEVLQMSNQQHFHYSHQLHCKFHLSPYDTPVQLLSIIKSEKGVPCKGGECYGQHRLSRADIEYWDLLEDYDKAGGKGSVAGRKSGKKNIPNRRPTPWELGRLSHLVEGSSFELLFQWLGISYAEIETVKKESLGLAGVTIITKMFLIWTNAYPNQTFLDIKKAMGNSDMATDRILAVIEVNKESSCRGMVPNEAWIRPPSDDEIEEIVCNIDKGFYNLCLELGLSPPVIDQHVICHSDNFQERMTALLQYWIKTFQKQATIGRLLTAMEVCQMDWHTTAEIWPARQRNATTQRRKRSGICSLI